MERGTLRRLLVSAGALVAGAGVSAGLLVYSNPDSGTKEFLVVARDLPAGAAIGGDTLRVERLRLGSIAATAFGPAERRSLAGSRIAHELRSGALLQRGDIAGPAGPSDRRLLLLPLREVPPVAPGDRLDLLLVSGSGDRLSVAPLAAGIEVRSVTAGGLVVALPARQASALVYAANVLHVVGVLADGGKPGQEPAITSLDQAQAALNG